MADLDAVRQGLRENIEALAEHLLGPHNHALSTRRHWRWGGSGGLSICITGPHRGACIDFRDGWRGDPLALVMREIRCDFKAALTWSGSWLGIDAGNYKPDPVAERRRQQEREQRQREQAAEDARDNARRIKKAQALWTKRRPDSIDTLGERYIAVTRRIPIKPSEWPDCVGCRVAFVVGWKKRTETTSGAKRPTPPPLSLPPQTTQAPSEPSSASSSMTAPSPWGMPAGRR
jgi:hypothetical protein